MRTVSVADLMSVSTTVQFNDNNRLVVNMYFRKQGKLPVVPGHSSSQCFCSIIVAVTLPHVPLHHSSELCESPVKILPL